MTALRVAGGRPLRGRVRVPGDKSISHRALLLAALAEGISVVRGLSTGADVAATAAAVQALGAVVDGHLVTGGRSLLHEPAGVVDVGNSGTTIRLLAGLCAGFDWLTVLAGDASIARRPMDRVADPLRRMGARVDGRNGGRLPPLTIRGGQLRGIDYDMPVASAQVKSAVLLAGLGAGGETVVRETRPTRAHTEEMLGAAGADIEVTEAGDGRTVRLRPSVLHPFELDIPGDPSHAAFWVVAACIVPGSELTLDDVYLGPARSGFLDVLDAMGADVELVGERSVRARHSPDLHGTDVEAHQIPGLIDEIPVLAVAAAFAEGTTTFKGAGELRVKESDRVATVTRELSALGGKVEPTDDGLTVTGTGGLHGAHVRSHGDHRVAMAMAVAGMAATGDTVVDGWDAVATSYPGFEEDLRRCVGQ